MLHPRVTALADKNMTARRIADQAAATARCPAPARRGPIDLAQAARRLQADLTAHRRPGRHRRQRTRRRELEDEIADVLIVTAVFAERAGIDLNAALAAKLAVIYSRG